MKFRFITKDGSGLALAYQIFAEGNDVDVFIQEKRAQRQYEGLLKKATTPTSGLTKDTIIIFDMVGLGSLASRLQEARYKVFGAGLLNDKLELDRAFAMRIAQAHGIRVPKWYEFTSFDKAIQFVRKNKDKWVFKPFFNKPPSFTYVGDELENQLLYYKSHWTGPVHFILQRRIDGVEVSTEGWFYDGKLYEPSVNWTLETKRFMEGDKGPNTGCMGSVVNQGKNIYAKTLKKLEPFLQKYKYTGPLDIALIIPKENKIPYFLEFTARFGYNAIYALAELLNQDISQVLYDSAMLNPSFELANDYAAAIRLTIPPWPSEGKVPRGLPVSIYKLDNIWLLDIKYDNNLQSIVTAGTDGLIAEVTARSDNWNKLNKLLYKNIDNLYVPNLQYRQDIISNARKRYEQLHRWGYV